MAEREGFEPPEPLRAHALSKRAHSTTLPPLRCPGESAKQSAPAKPSAERKAPRPRGSTRNCSTRAVLDRSAQNASGQVSSSHQQTTSATRLVSRVAIRPRLFDIGSSLPCPPIYQSSINRLSSITINVLAIEASCPLPTGLPMATILRAAINAACSYILMAIVLPRSPSMVRVVPFRRRARRS